MIEDCGTGDWMQTYTGRKFFPFAPRAEDICIEDIAHHLAMMCRYNGASEDFLSIAEHSVHVSYHVAPGDELWGLLHDAPEFAIGDMIRPVKHHPTMRPFRVIEDRIMLAVCEKFGLPPKMPASVKDIDSRICLTEGDLLLPNKPEPWNIPGPPVPANIQCWPPRTAKRKFLERFKELTEEFTTRPKPPQFTSKEIDDKVNELRSLATKKRI